MPAWPAVVVSVGRGRRARATPALRQGVHLGVHLKVVCEMPGFASITPTFDTNSHLVPMLPEAAVAMVRVRGA